MWTPSSIVIAGVIVAVVYLTTVTGLAILAALRAGGRREEPQTDYEARLASRFTIPVSIILPVSTTSAGVPQAVSALLRLDYPEFEVIVVADGAPPALIASLVPEWQLEAKEFFYRRSVETADVQRIYRSARDSRLMVIDKAAGGYSDAMNCGVNVARYRYVMSVGPGIDFDAGALLRAMSAPLRDSARVVGASSHVEVGGEPYGGLPATTAEQAASVWSRPGAAFQRMASLRSLMASRLAWQHLRSGFGPPGGVFVWRRDALLKAQGFSKRAADPDLDMMFRVQAASANGSVRFDRGSHVFGRVGVRQAGRVLQIAERRRLAALQILWSCLRGRGGGIEGRAMAYLTLSEIVTPVAVFWVVAGTLAGGVFGWLPWSAFALAIVVLSFGHAAITAAALLLHGAAPNAPGEPELRHLLLSGPLEFVCYRAAVAPARLVTMVRLMF